MNLREKIIIKYDWTSSFSINILHTSNQLNLANGITGILYFSSQYFLQYLEGENSHVESTYERICRDPRHTNLRIVDRAAIDSRDFSSWSMAYVPKSDILIPLNLEFMNGTDFNPKEISNTEALELVFKLRSLLPQAHYEEITP